MWHFWNGAGWMGWFWMIGMALFWIVVIVAVVIAVRALSERSRSAGPGVTTRETPLEILQKRYARGEIDKKEYEEKMKDLS